MALHLDTFAPKQPTMRGAVMTLFLTSIGNGDVLLWMLEFLFLVVWFWLLIAIFADLFRDRDTSGGAKALWTIFVVIVTTSRHTASADDSRR
jgi:uncharacterized membrane protein YhaH (DUF805 family)